MAKKKIENEQENRSGGCNADGCCVVRRLRLSGEQFSAPGKK